MVKKWKSLPTDKNDDGRALSEMEMILGLNSIIAEWLDASDRDESVRECELPLLTRIKTAWEKGEFSKGYIDTIKMLLEKYVKCGDNELAVDIACEILGSSREELGAGSIAATQVLKEIEDLGKE